MSHYENRHYTSNVTKRQHHLSLKLQKTSQNENQKIINEGQINYKYGLYSPYSIHQTTD